MKTEKIKLKTEAGQTIEAVMLNKHADRIPLPTPSAARHYRPAGPSVLE